jgi:hypothetical protein
MGGPCRTYGILEKYTQNLVGYLKGRDHSKDLGIHERVTLEWLVGK